MTTKTEADRQPAPLPRGGQGVRPAPRGREPRRGRRGAGVPWLYLAPAMLVLLVMTVAPTLFILYSSVRNDTILGGAGSFVGLDNFVTALTDPATLRSFWVTLLFVAVVVILEMALGLALAVPLARPSTASKGAAK